MRLKFLRSALRVWTWKIMARGFAPAGAQRIQGIGLVGMRERAELIGGTLELLQPERGGTLVRLQVPREKAEAHGG